MAAETQNKLTVRLRNPIHEEGGVSDKPRLREIMGKIGFVRGFSPSDIERQLSFQNIGVIEVESEGKKQVVGLLGVHPSSLYENNYDEIQYFIMDPDYLDRGIEGQVFDELERRLGREKTRLQMQVDDTNDSLIEMLANNRFRAERVIHKKSWWKLHHGIEDIPDQYVMRRWSSKLEEIPVIEKDIGEPLKSSSSKDIKRDIPNYIKTAQANLTKWTGRSWEIVCKKESRGGAADYHMATHEEIRAHPESVFFRTSAAVDQPAQLYQKVIKRANIREAVDQVSFSDIAEHVEIPVSYAVEIAAYTKSPRLYR